MHPLASAPPAAPPPRRSEAGGRRPGRPPARGTRALGRMGRERPGALLARRTRTIRMCSFDARSKGQPGPLPLREVYEVGNLRWTCAVGDLSGPSWDSIHEQAWKDFFGHSMRPCLGQGASWRARVGRVRSLAILSVLRKRYLVMPYM